MNSKAAKMKISDFRKKIQNAEWVIEKDVPKIDISVNPNNTFKKQMIRLLVDWEHVKRTAGTKYKFLAIESNGTMVLFHKRPVPLFFEEEQMFRFVRRADDDVEQIVLMSESMPFIPFSDLTFNEQERLVFVISGQFF